MHYIKSAATIVAAGVGLSLLAAPMAHAGISVGGDSDWKITVKTSVSNGTPKKGTTINGNVTIDYVAKILGIPLPVTGYIISSFPDAPFAKPVVTGDNCLGSTADYKFGWDSYMGKNAWVVSGSQGFWGSNTLYIKGKAKADAVKSGYFHGGTGTGHTTDANARDLVQVKK